MSRKYNGSFQKELVRGVLPFTLIAIPQAVEERLESIQVRGGHLEACENPAEIGAVIPVMKEADVPAPAELVEKGHQRPWTLRELEPADLLIRDVAAPPADHVAHVELRDFVAGQIDRAVAALIE